MQNFESTALAFFTAIRGYVWILVVAGLLAEPVREVAVVVDDADRTDVRQTPRGIHHDIRRAQERDRLAARRPAAEAQLLRLGDRVAPGRARREGELLMRALLLAGALDAVAILIIRRLAEGVL